MTQQLLWDEAVGRLRSRVSPQNYDMWLRPIEMKSWDGATLRLRAPNSYVRLWFESNFLSTLVQELRELGHHEVRVEFDPDGEDRIPQAAPLEMPIGSSPTVALIVESSARTQQVSVTTTPTATAAMTDDEPGIRVPDNATLNPRYTFDTFVAGPSNQLAFAASQAAASSYPPKYNPVFICGGAGLGKTHLLHAIGHQQLTNRPNARIVYISS
jgi:chromosomal replication initiator protein